MIFRKNKYLFGKHYLKRAKRHPIQKKRHIRRRGSTQFRPPPSLFSGARGVVFVSVGSLKHTCEVVLILVFL
jgi:hypothetical protein